MRLVAEHLAVERGGREIFRPVSFALAEGQALIVTGPNGAGKSTLIKAICGLLPPAAGSIRLEGAGEASLDESCHYLGHANALKPSLSVRENLEFWRAFLGGEDVVETALDRVGLVSLIDLPAGYLSAGQQRRVAIARLLVARRPVWLVDEPTAALDRQAEARFGEIAAAHLQAGGILVAATHQKLAITARQLELGALEQTE